jgi:hypothetical protein
VGLTGGEERADFLIRGLGEVFEPLADGVEAGRGVEADDLVGLLGKAMANAGVCDRNGDNDSGWFEGAQRRDGSAHGSAGGEAIVDEKDGFAADVDRRAVAAVSGEAAVELDAFAGHDLVEIFLRDAKVADEGGVEDFNTAGSDGADGKLRLLGRAELANHPDVERSVEGAGDLIGHGNTAARQGEDEEIGMAGEGGEALGEKLSGVGAVVEVHGALADREYSMFGTDDASSLQGWARSVAAALDLVLAAGDAGDGLRVGDVLLGEDAAGEGVGVVCGQNRDGALEDDDAVVEVLVDEMDGTAGDGYAVVEGLLLGVEAGKGGEQGGVDVEDAVGKGVDEFGREQAHVAGETNEIDIGGAKVGEHVAVVIGARAASGDADLGGQAEVASGLDAGGVSDVGEDERDFGVGELAGADVAGDGEEVGAAAG